MSSTLIRIEFTQREQQFLSFVFIEIFGGGSTAAIQAVLGDSVSQAKDLHDEVRMQVAKNENGAGSPIALSASQWRTMFESVHAVVYGLGPSELQTCTGLELHETANINLKICNAVWGVYGGSSWSG